MSEQYYGTIAALEFSAPSRQLFRTIVGDIDDTFQPYGMTKCCSTWLGDHVAVIERDSLRLLLGWLPSSSDSDHCVLVFSVGHATVGGNILVPRETCEFVRDVLLSHLESHLQFDTVFRADATQPVDIDLVSTVAEILEMGDAAPAHTGAQNINDRPQRRTRALTRDIMLAAASPRQPDAAAEQPLAEVTEVSEVAKVSEIIEPGWQDHPAPDEELSLQKRLTIYALGATMLIYTPPVGATLLVYTTLRDFAAPKQPERLAA